MPSRSQRPLVEFGLGAAARRARRGMEADCLAEAGAVRRPDGSGRSGATPSRRSPTSRERLTLRARSVLPSIHSAPTPARPVAKPRSAFVPRLQLRISRQPRQRSGIGQRPDPKDRRELAARIAQVTSGELSGPALLAALEGIVHDDPRKRPGAAQARLRAPAGRQLQKARKPAFHAAAAGRTPPAPTSTSGWRPAWVNAAISPGPSGALAEARRIEPDKPRRDRQPRSGPGRPERRLRGRRFSRCPPHFAADPAMHEARFNLAVVYSKGRPPRRGSRHPHGSCWNACPPNAPERSEGRAAAPGRPVVGRSTNSDYIHAQIQRTRPCVSQAGRLGVCPQMHQQQVGCVLIGTK